MIRYSITLAELKKRVKAKSSTWLTRAKKFTTASIAAGKVEGKLSIWSEIKPIFLDIQHNKCIYCERLLPSSDFGLVEHDVEHYRPKNRVTVWPAAKDLQDLGLTAYPFPTGAGGAGYIGLAFDVSNYAASCKVCNSTLKADRFPIAGPRAASLSPAALAAEKPFLLLPLGSGDDDPMKLIGFNGILPFPLDSNANSVKHRRARVTIDFYRLASPKRESDVLLPRLEACALFASKFKERKAATTAAERKRLDGLLDALMEPRKPHVNCVRSYAALCKSQPAKAEAMAVEFDSLIEKGVRALFP